MWASRTRQASSNDKNGTDLTQTIKMRWYSPRVFTLYRQKPISRRSLDSSVGVILTSSGICHVAKIRAQLPVIQGHHQCRSRLDNDADILPEEEGGGGGDSYNIRIRGCTCHIFGSEL